MEGIQGLGFAVKTGVGPAGGDPVKDHEWTVHYFKTLSAAEKWAENWSEVMKNREDLDEIEYIYRIQSALLTGKRAKSVKWEG